MLIPVCGVSILKNAYTAKNRAVTTVILVALGWNLTGGQLTSREILGCVLMFVAILLVQLPERKRS
jgi:drug/metabolite transporter (DMT)-like permease